ncbi:MAG: aspartate aminotransferase family protein [Halofilum sp. (in: g-proteobacteria)]
MADWGHTGASDETPFLLNERSLEAHAEAIHEGLWYVQTSMKRAERPFSGIDPAELARYFAEIDLDRPRGDLTSALEEVDALYLAHAVYYHRPQYLAHLNCPVALAAAVGELIQGSVNTAVETWDQSGGGTLIEQKIIDWTAARIGFGSDADGVFTSGGTQSNLMALLLARDAHCRDHLGLADVQRTGLPESAQRLRIFSSEVAHFSVQKAAGVLGLGSDAVIPVACDEAFRMDPVALECELERALADGTIPMAVIATVGTTDFGSIDPVTPIARLCRRYGLWLHADAAYGCGLLVSPDNARLLDGIEHADSVAVDYHKSFFQPVSCSALLVRDRRHLSAVTWHADYLNPYRDAAKGVPNLVDKSMQTTRRFDALKLWLTLRTAGPEAIGRRFDRLLGLAARIYWQLGADDDFEAVNRPSLSTLVFRYRPAGVVSRAQLDQVNTHIRDELMRSGEALIAATTVRGAQHLKFTLLDPETTAQDVREVIEAIRRCGERWRAASGAAGGVAGCASQEAS